MAESKTSNVIYGLASLYAYALNAVCSRELIHYLISRISSFFLCWNFKLCLGLQSRRSVAIPFKKKQGQLRSHSSCNCMKAVLRWQSVLKQAQVAFEAMQSGDKCQQ